MAAWMKSCASDETTETDPWSWVEHMTRSRLMTSRWSRYECTLQSTSRVRAAQAPQESIEQALAVGSLSASCQGHFKHASE